MQKDDETKGFEGEFADVAAALRAMPQRTPSPDLADRVMAAVHSEALTERIMAAVHREAVAEKAARRFHWVAAAGIAAAVAAIAYLSVPAEDGASRIPSSILARVGASGTNATEGAAASAATAVASTASAASDSGATAADWLASQQGADGTWTPSKLGGTDSYRAALTGLAAMALAQSDDPAHVEAARRAADALAAAQRADGSFSDNGIAQLYNQGIATRALFHVRERTGSDAWDGALRSAVAFIGSTQSASGGWDYNPADPGNTALTIWQIDALAQARAAGWGDPRGCLRRGLRWLGSQVGADGSVAYREAGHAASGSSTLSAMGAWGLTEFGSDFAALAPAAARAMEHLAEAGDVTGIEPSKNLYRDLFAVRAFRAGNRAEAEDVAARMAAIRETGDNAAGAWRGDGDPWNRAGGDLYATSVALLALAEPRG